MTHLCCIFKKRSCSRSLFLPSIEKWKPFPYFVLLSRRWGQQTEAISYRNWLFSITKTYPLDDSTRRRSEASSSNHDMSERCLQIVVEHQVNSVESTFTNQWDIRDTAMKARMRRIRLRNENAWTLIKEITLFESNVSKVPTLRFAIDCYNLHEVDSGKEFLLTLGAIALP